MTYAFGNLPPSKTVQLLIKTASNQDEDEAVRIAAIEGMGFIQGPSSSEAAREALKVFLTDTKAAIPIRVAAARSLGRLA